jgi:hypothetical protein
MDRNSQVRLRAHKGRNCRHKRVSRLLGDFNFACAASCLWDQNACITLFPWRHIMVLAADSILCSCAVFTHAGRLPWRLRSVASHSCSGWARAPRNPWLWSHTLPSSCLSSTR